MHEGISDPTRYRVVVRGLVGPDLATLFGDLHVDARGSESSLTGSFDQAQLHGLLERLQDLGIPIVSVNPVE